MVGAADEDIADEDGDGEEGVDVVVREGSCEVVEGGEDCVPTQEGVDAVDREDEDCFVSILLHQLK